MTFKKTLIALASAATITGCSAEATTPVIDAETPREAVQAYLIGLCEGDSEQILNQTIDPSVASDGGFETLLKSEQRQCEKYGGFKSIKVGWVSPGGDNMNAAIVFNDGTETVEQRYNTTKRNGYYKVRRGLPRMCHKSRGCFED